MEPTGHYWLSLAHKPKFQPTLNMKRFAQLFTYFIRLLFLMLTLHM